MDYLVDVIMSTYNHEKYIAQAIEGVVKQKTNFRFRLIIGEDCSTDSTRSIIRKYEAAYPDIVKPIYREKNIGSLANGCSLFQSIESKYGAICEGDDYWTDYNKLQKQADYLEAHPDFSMCFTDVQIVDEMGWDKPTEAFFPKIEKDVLEMDDFIYSFMSVIPTPTVFFRNVLPNPLPDFFMKTINADIFLHFIAADAGKTKYFPEKTAIYRNHSGGITKTEEILKGGDDMRFLLYNEMNKFLGYRYNTQFRKQLLEMVKVQMIYGSRNKGFFSKLKNLKKYSGYYIHYSDKVNYKEIAYYMSMLFFPSLLKLKSKMNSNN
jgi:glycosyltransferase involved in cell wall biosynthesis